MAASTKNGTNRISPIQSGERTQSHDQAMTPVSLRTMNAIVNIDANDIWLVVLVNPSQWGGKLRNQAAMHCSRELVGDGGHDGISEGSNSVQFNGYPIISSAWLALNKTPKRFAK